MKLRRIRVAFAAALPICLVAAACGSSKGSASSKGLSGEGGNTFTGTGASSNGSSGSTGSGHGGSGGSVSSNNGGGIGLGGSVNTGPIIGLTLLPATATLNVTSGATATEAFQAIAEYQDHSTTPVQGATWSATSLAIGSIDGSGNFTATGNQGGTVQVTAALDGLTATATLTVVVHLVDNPTSIDGPSQTLLQNATTPDSSFALAYPYDGMTYPRGINAPALMWAAPLPDAGVADAGGPSSDVIYVHLVSNGFELQSYQTNLSQLYNFDPATWAAFSQSSTGPAQLTVARLEAGATSATVLARQTWTIAPGAMRGTIYYWAINAARVVRIQPGAAAPDDFLNTDAGAPTCPSCHTVSANGSNLVMNQGNWPDETSFSYNLGTSSTNFSGFSDTTGASQWAMAGVSPDGTTIVQNFSPLRGPIGVQTGAFNAMTGQQIPSTGLEGNKLGMPAFSADGQLLVYVDTTTGDLHAYDWDPVNLKATNDRILVTAANNATLGVINAPTVSPDHKWVIYQRSTANGSENNIPGDLYMTSVTQPGAEVALDQLNGATYPFLAGSRDHDQDFEPTFAPVAAGGYFWVVFHSRRTYGNALTGPAFVAEGNGVKQLWVAAIDQAPSVGADPSHAPFWLPGQDLTTLNMRGYWSLPPCAADGAGCQTGTDCCGGYCDSSSDSGAPVCKSTSTNGCSSDGDHCTTASDCCDANDSCINNVCSVATPM